MESRDLAARLEWVRTLDRRWGHDEILAVADALTEAERSTPDGVRIECVAASALWELQRPDEARRRLQRARDLATALDDPGTLAQVLYRLTVTTVGDAEEQGALLEPALALALEGGDTECAGLVALSMVLQLARDAGPTAAWPLLEQGCALLGDAERPLQLQVEGHLQTRLGEHEAAEVVLREALALAREEDDPFRIANVLTSLAGVAVARHRLDEAAALLERQVALLEAHGCPGVRTSAAWSNLASVHQDRGDGEAAEAAYRAAIRAASPDRPAIAAQVALGCIEARRGELDAARARLGGLVEQGSLKPELRLPAKLGLARCAAATGDLLAWRAALRGIDLLLERSFLLSSSVAELTEEAAEVALEHGLPPRAAGRALAVAHALWRKLDVPERAEAVVDRHRGLAPGSTPVGPFDLQGVLGTGAAGTVYRALTRRDDAVAIKVLRHPTRSEAMLQAELQAIARLDHPHIVWLVDHGRVDATTAALDDRLPEGAPWIAMELVEGGTLAPHCGALPWSTCRTLLLALLDALAHAHARGVLHLDVKPANVLVGGSARALEPKLVDFGIAANLDDPARRSLGGTPAYMAPEQFDRRPELLGPWTDLYALGGLAVALVSGTAPFGTTGSVSAFSEAHRSRPLPPLEPRVPVPDGLEAWLRRLLTKSPDARFRTAADAARALVALPEPADARPLRSAPVAVGQLTTMPLDLDPAPLVVIPPTVDDGGGCAIPPPRLPRDWRRPASGPRLTLRDAGLRLLPYRQPPLVGRERERDQLWRALAETVETSRPRGVVLHGTARDGTSSLASWLGERAREAGLWSVHSPDPGETDAAAVRAAATRPVVWVVDTVSTREDADRVAAVLDEALPVLVVVAGGSAAEAVEAHPACARLPVPPLSPDEQRALVAAILPLTPSLAERILSRTGGRPGRVVELLSELATQGMLVPSPDGYRSAAYLGLPSPPSEP